MLVGGVIHDQIKDDPHSALRGLVCEIHEVARRTVAWIDTIVVCDVITRIAIRRRLKRLQPQTSHTEARQVIETTGQAFEVADAVAVRIHERADIEAVDDCVFVPEIVDHSFRLRAIALALRAKRYPAFFRNAAMRGARLLGLSRLKERASPSCSRMYFSVAAIAASRALSLIPKEDQTIFSDSMSYSHRPTSRPRSTIAWFGNSVRPTIFCSFTCSSSIKLLI